VDFDEEEEEIYDTVFKRFFTKTEFRKLTRVGHYKIFQPEEVIIQQGAPSSCVYLIVGGACAVEESVNKHDVLHQNENIPGKEETLLIYYLRDGQLAGEMESGGFTSASERSTVKAVHPTKCLVWEKDSLKKLLWRNVSMKIGWNSFVSEDLFVKLQNHREISKEQQYKLFLYAILVDDRINDKEREAVELYHKQCNISEELHKEVLTTLGWTEEDYKKGYRSTKWHWLQRKFFPWSHDSSTHHGHPQVEATGTTDQNVQHDNELTRFSNVLKPFEERPTKEKQKKPEHEEHPPIGEGDKTLAAVLTKA